MNGDLISNTACYRSRYLSSCFKQGKLITGCNRSKPSFATWTHPGPKPRSVRVTSQEFPLLFTIGQQQTSSLLLLKVCICNLNWAGNSSMHQTHIEKVIAVFLSGLQGPPRSIWGPCHLQEGYCCTNPEQNYCTHRPPPAALLPALAQSKGGGQP